MSAEVEIRFVGYREDGSRAERRADEQDPRIGAVIRMACIELHEILRRTGEVTAMDERMRGVPRHDIDSGEALKNRIQKLIRDLAVFGIICSTGDARWSPGAGARGVWYVKLLTCLDDVPEEKRMPTLADHIASQVCPICGAAFDAEGRFTCEPHGGQDVLAIVRNRARALVESAETGGERPNMCKASPAVLETWQGTRPDLTLQQFIELVVLAVGKAGRQREPRRRRTAKPRRAQGKR